MDQNVESLKYHITNNSNNQRDQILLNCKEALEQLSQELESEKQRSENLKSRLQEVEKEAAEESKTNQKLRRQISQLKGNLSKTNFKMNMRMKSTKLMSLEL